MSVRPLLAVTAMVATLCADTIVLRDGKTVEGSYLGGGPRQIRVAVGDDVQTFDVNNVSEIRFAQAPQTAPPAPPERERVRLTNPDRPVPSRSNSDSSRSGVEVPAGSTIVVRMIDDVDSERDRVGQMFKASIDEAVLAGTDELIARGADATVKLVADEESGRLTGRTSLTLDLVSVNVGGKDIDVLSQEVTQASESRTGRTAKVVGGTAALGAIIGAVAGGGKGAAVGAVTGAAAGGAVQVMTKGQRVRIPSETRLSFTLQQPVKLK